MEATPLELLGGFLIHNILSISILILLIFAWKRPVVGFVDTLIWLDEVNDWRPFGSLIQSLGKASGWVKAI